MLTLKRWHDPVNVIAGLWMLVSPWALAFAAETRPMWNSVVLGILIAAVALHAMFRQFAWQEWTQAFCGAWLIASPWVLGFSALSAAAINAVGIGGVVLAAALWALADRDFGGWWKTART